MTARHALFKFCQWATRSTLRWALGVCIEQSPAGNGAWHRCVLWKGHRTKHRSATGALWSPSGRIPPRVPYARHLPRESRGLRRMPVLLLAVALSGTFDCFWDIHFVFDEGKLFIEWTRTCGWL